jgi:hypothetical protein
MVLMIYRINLLTNMNFFATLVSTLLLKQNFSIFQSQKESIMKQAVKKAGIKKILPTDKVNASASASKTSKVDNANMPNVQKAIPLSRFLEASCDCV